MRIKSAALWTLGMAFVLGMSIGVAYGERAGGKTSTRRFAIAAPSVLAFGAGRLSSSRRHAPLSSTSPPNPPPKKGLAGFVEYPTQELVSGLLPLDQLALLPNYTATDCVKPGMGLAGYNATNAIPGGLVGWRLITCMTLLWPGRSITWGGWVSGFAAFGWPQLPHLFLAGRCSPDSHPFASNLVVADRSATATAAPTPSRPGRSASPCPSTSWPSSRCLVGGACGCSVAMIISLQLHSPNLLLSFRSSHPSNHPPPGWILFLVFAGWGMLAAPIDWIHQYMRRPRAVITKSEFISRARGLAQRAKEIRVGGGWDGGGCISEGGEAAAGV
jgi:hypothetical protein